MEIYGNLWKSMEIHGNPWKLRVVVWSNLLKSGNRIQTSFCFRESCKTEGVVFSIGWREHAHFGEVMFVQWLSTFPDDMPFAMNMKCSTLHTHRFSWQSLHGLILNRFPLFRYPITCPFLAGLKKHQRSRLGLNVPIWFCVVILTPIFGKLNCSCCCLSSHVDENVGIKF